MYVAARWPATSSAGSFPPAAAACVQLARSLATATHAVLAGAQEPLHLYGDQGAKAAAAEAVAARGGFTDICVDQAVEVSARGGGQLVPAQRIPAAQVPDFFRAHLAGLTAADVLPVVEQLIDLHFCEVGGWAHRPW